jgi:hypothetical protein
VIYVPLFLAVSFKGSDYKSVSCNDKRGADINMQFSGALSLMGC